MKFSEAIKKAEFGDIIILDDYINDNIINEEPWVSFILAKNGDLIYINGVEEIGADELNSNRWSIKNDGK